MLALCFRTSSSNHPLFGRSVIKLFAKRNPTAALASVTTKTETDLTSAMTRRTQTIQRFASTSSSSETPKSDPDDKKRDEIRYEIKFKQVYLRDQIKKLYSLYGPVFIVCHIGVSLTSLGFWYSLVYMSIDPTQFMPPGIKVYMSQRLLGYSGEGGKFIIAYAIHKVLLPIRLFVSYYLTRFLAPKVKPYSERLISKFKK